MRIWIWGLLGFEFGKEVEGDEMMGALVISAYDRDGYNSLPKWIHAVGE